MYLNEPNGHLPFHKNEVPLHDSIDNFHFQLFGALCQTLRHRGKFADSPDFLDGIPEMDIVIVIGENVRPVGFAFGVIGFLSTDRAPVLWSASKSFFPS
jgi:hypothetical protein